MKIRKAPSDYIITYWVTTCSECGCEYEFSRKDTHLFTHSIDGKREYFVQCPYCGKWTKVL